MRRRHALAALAAPLLRAGKTEPFRWAVCSETFAGQSFAAACAAAGRLGYAGMEVAPFHLGSDPARLTPGERADARRAIRDAGLGYVGTHAVLQSPAGLHLTTADATVRGRSWEYLRAMIALTGELGAPAVLALGSAKQRQAVGGVTPAEATARLREGLAACAPAAKDAGVTVLLEPLAPHLCNVVTTLAEASAVVETIGHPAVQTMFDTHNCAAEPEPHADALARHYRRIRHVHLNEMNGQRPGAGDYDFAPILQRLRALRYQGWVSVEVFDFRPDGETVARLALQHLRATAGKTA